jgi:hypothetical protein
MIGEYIFIQSRNKRIIGVLFTSKMRPSFELFSPLVPTKKEQLLYKKGN